MHAVRLLSVDDAEAFVTLRKAMLLESPWAFASSPEIDRGCNVELVRDSITRSGSAILGAFDGGSLVGACGLVRDEKPKRCHIAVIWGVYVAPQVRRHGLGRQIVQAAIVTARSWQGVECIQLTVSEKAAAARMLYESLSFTAWGREPDALRVEGASFAETHMRLDIGPEP